MFALFSPTNSLVVHFNNEQLCFQCGQKHWKLFFMQNIWFVQFVSTCFFFLSPFHFSWNARWVKSEYTFLIMSAIDFNLKFHRCSRLFDWISAAEYCPFLWTKWLKSNRKSKCAEFAIEMEQEEIKVETKLKSNWFSLQPLPCCFLLLILFSFQRSNIDTIAKNNWIKKFFDLQMDLLVFH